MDIYEPAVMERELWTWRYQLAQKSGDPENKKDLAFLPGLFIENGGRRQSRTADTRIFNPLLYQLSYPAIFCRMTICGYGP